MYMYNIDNLMYISLDSDGNDILCPMDTLCIIQLLHVCECNMKFYRTLENDIARGAAECNIIFQSAVKFHIARTKSVIIVLLYDCCLD